LVLIIAMATTQHIPLSGSVSLQPQPLQLQDSRRNVTALNRVCPSVRVINWHYAGTADRTTDRVIKRALTSCVWRRAAEPELLSSSHMPCYL
jgi:hypothetical protein